MPASAASFHYSYLTLSTVRHSTPRKSQTHVPPSGPALTPPLHLESLCLISIHLCLLSLKTERSSLPPERFPGLPTSTPHTSELCARLSRLPHLCSPASLLPRPCSYVSSEQPVSPTGLGFPEEGSVWVHPCMLSATCFGPGTQVLSKCVLNESSTSFHLHRGEGWGKVVRRTGQPGQRGTQSKGHPLHSQFPGKLAHNNQLSPPASLSPQNLS